MAEATTFAHPYVGVNISQLDQDFFSLLVHADGMHLDKGKEHVPGEGLSARETRLFQFGVLVGQGDWPLARQVIGSAIDEGLVTGPEAERAVNESVLIKGGPACFHLTPALTERGLHGPASILEAVTSIKALNELTPTSESVPEKRLSERETFALGLGVSLGARCWDS
ncbi:MAG: hypothetical protein HQK55_13425 [Deltaproteobacteria bacterium]|nr:hypothetical protein [Deltaproteobacteria bacterium]